MRNRRCRKTGVWPVSNICTIGANIWFVTCGGGDGGGDGGGGDANRRVLPSRATAVAILAARRRLRARATACFRSGRPAKHEAAAAIETPLLAPLAAASLARARNEATNAAGGGKKTTRWKGRTLEQMNLADSLQMQRSQFLFIFCMAKFLKRFVSPLKASPNLDRL